MAIIGSSTEYTHGVVPATATVSGWHIALVKIGILIALPAFIMGAEIASLMGLRRAGISMLLGAIVLGGIAVLTGTVAALSRQSTALLVRYAFGTAGAQIVGGVLAITLLGLFGITAELFGASLSRIASTALDWNVSPALCTVTGSVLMVLTTIYGFRGLQKLADLAVPLLFLALVAVTLMALRNVDMAVLLATPADLPPLGMGISAVIGGLAVGVTILPDLARFAHTAEHARWAAAGTYSLALPIVLMLAAIPSVVTGERDLTLIMAGIGLGVPALLFLIFTAWTTNSGNLYSSALGLANVFTRSRFLVLVSIAGVIGTGFALLGVGERLIPFLVILSITIPPIAGIYIADFFFIRKKRYDEQELPNLPQFAWPAFAAWGLAIAVALVSASGAIFITGVPACDAIFVALLSYYLLMRRRSLRVRQKLIEL